VPQSPLRDQPQNPPQPRSPGRQRPNRLYRFRPHHLLSGRSPSGLGGVRDV